MSIGSSDLIIFLSLILNLGVWGPIGANVMIKKGRSALAGYLLGALIGLIGLLVAALISRDDFELRRKELQNIERTKLLTNYSATRGMQADPLPSNPHSLGVTTNFEVELRKAAKMREEGLITDEEFQTLKKKLIESVK